MLDITDVRKTFNVKTVNERIALDGVSLHLEAEDFVTVIGGNGAGKSTLLNAIAGVWPVDSGSIVIDGRDITGMPEHKRAIVLGRVFQDPMMGTAATMQIEENLALAARRGDSRTLKTGITREERAAYRDQLAQLGLGLEDRMTAKVGLLSGGQRQALTLLMAAKVLELSEKIIRENHLMTLMVTHNMKDAIRYGNRLIMMNEGRIILDISGEEKKQLTIERLMEAFAKASGETFVNDRMLLS